MEKIKWISNYNIGNTLIDSEHQYLIGIINEVIEKRKDMNLEDLKLVFVKLIEYSKFHFTNEETLMKKVGYEYIEIHREQHKKFIAELLRVNKEIIAENQYISFEILVYLSEWFINHIQVMDKGIKPYLMEEDI